MKKTEAFVIVRKSNNQIYKVPKDKFMNKLGHLIDKDNCIHFEDGSWLRILGEF